MGQVIRLLREGQKLHVVGDDLLAKIDELPTAYLSEALTGCQIVRRQITILLELAASAETMIGQVDSRIVRHKLYEKQGNSHLELTAAFAKISAAIHALSVTLSGRRPNADEGAQ
jgi:hypothetical protein